MSDIFFLPAWPPDLGTLPWFAVLLLSGAAAGEAVQRVLRLPRLLGWIAVGIALGPHASGALSASELANMNGVLDVAIGTVLFELGQRVDLSWLRRNPWLLGTSILESGLSFGAMYFVLVALGAPALIAMVAAAIGIATAPAVVLTVTRDLRAQGQVSERVLLLTALNSTYAFITISMLFAWLAQEYTGGWQAVAGHPLYLIFGSVALAAALAAVTLPLLRALGRRAEAQFICIVALVIVAVWLANALKLSNTLTLLGYGTLLRVFDRRRRLLPLDFGRVGRIFLILLFGITAASLDLSLLPAGALAAVAYIAARFFGKALGMSVLAGPSGLSQRRAALVSLSLTPMSGMAVIMVHQTAAHHPAFGPALATIVISATVMLELVGPLFAHFAILRSGEGLDGGRT